MKTIKHAVAMAIFLSSASVAGVVLASGHKLQEVTAQAAGSNQTEVRLQFDSPVNLPKGVVLENPPRLVFDFSGTEVNPGSRQKTVNIGKVQTVEAADNKGKTRVVVRMQQLVNYTVEVQGNAVVMLFDGDCGTTCAPPASTPIRSGAAKASPNLTADDKKPPVAVVPELPPSVVLPAPPPAPVTAAVNNASALRGIDFRREADGGGRVVITLPSAETKVSDEKRGNTVTLSMADVDVPKHLQHRMDVMDFGTPASEVDVAQRDMGARIRISAHEGFEYRTQRNGNEYTVFLNKIKITPEEKLAAAGEKKKNFTGEKLSLNFQDIEVRAVLQLLADFTNKNIVVSDTVQGNITVRLKDVPWDQALDIVLESKHLGMKEEGNVIWVVPATEMAAQTAQELKEFRDRQELEPLVSEAIPINFAKAADIAALLQSSSSTRTSGSSELSSDTGRIHVGNKSESLKTSATVLSYTNMLSDRGSVSSDERTNTLLVQDTASTVKGIRELIKLLDVPVQQVLIESRIVSATDEFGKDLGARFGVTPHWANKDSVGIGSLAGSDKYYTSIAEAAADETGKTAITLPGLNDRLSVNLPVAGAAGSYGFSILTKDFMVDMELSALQAESKGEIISSPKVITSNQTKALIEQGVEIPYQEASSSGASTTSFKKAVLSMEVTPQITPDEHISMDLKVNQDTVGSIYSGIPSINTREIQTKVLVENGQTIVLGGVHEEENINSTKKVPVLGDVPVLGRLFRTDSKSNDKRELLIFVTPKIVDGKS